MPGIKRPNLEPGPDEDEEEVRSSIGSNKRARVSGRIEVSDADSSSSSDDERRDPSPKEGLHDANDDANDDDDLSADDFDDTELVEQMQQRTSRPSHAAENGIIESITCTNFMCHAHLHVELGPLINFVIGQNGSGKSAVLTALTICLGGKASSTNRASTLKAFIKEGQDSCTLAVRIKNKNGYQPDVFGDVIQVERSFSKTGTSGFKIKTATGRIMSTTRAALDDILDFYALGFDNPICVLTQDMARQFLSNSTPSDKYKFFIKGVQLEQLNHDYELLEQYIDNISSVHESRAPLLEELRRKRNNVKRRLDMLSQQSDVEERCTQLSGQMAWAQVEEQEKLADDCELAVRQAQANIDTAQATIDEKSTAFTEADDAHQRSEEAERTEAEKQIPITAELEEAETALADAQKEVADAHSEQRQCKENLTKHQQSIAKTNREIAVERSRLEEASGGSATARFERFESAKEALARLQQESREHMAQLPALMKESEDAKQKVGEHKIQWQSRRKDVSDAENLLRSLQNNQNRGQWEGFPPQIPRLVAAIDAASGFRQKPVGPVGKHIKLLDPKWSSVLERNFGGLLNGFIVTCKEDRDKLNGIMRNVNAAFNINILRAQPRFNVSAQEPSSEYSTIARMLDIDNDLVFNQLIISQKIEQIMLMEVEDEATDLLSRGRIKNVTACLTLDQSQPGIGHNYQWNSQGGGLSQKFIESYPGLPRMQTSIEDQVRLQSSIVNRLKDEQRTIDQRHRQLQEEQKSCEQALVRHKRGADEFRRSRDTAQQDIDEIQKEIDNSSIEEGRLNSLQEALETAKRQLQDDEEALQAINDNKEEQVSTLRQRELTAGEIQGRLEDARRNIEHAREMTIKKADERRTALRAKNQGIAGHEAACAERETLIAERHQQDNKVQTYMREASKISSRVPVPPNQNSEMLQAILIKLVADHKKAQKEAGGSLDQVAEEYRSASEAYRSFQKIMNQEVDLLSTMKYSLLERQNRWRRFRKFISARARTTFMSFLSERAFKGHLVINHDTRQLQILIQPNDSDPSSAARQAKTLSGGEKSFSTICLILSLWEAICAPVRCLDEFDVFMDSANREISTTLLISAANQAQERQFIFITPQSMQSVKDSPDIRLIRMRNPERGQTTLDLNH